jgi:thiol-disulfide isomerase/thioredoxin
MGRSGKWRLVVGGVLIGLGLGLVFLIVSGAGRELWTRMGLGQSVRLAEAAPEVGLPAPEIQLAQLDGTPLRLSDLKGKAVLVNFWATWCGPCRVEMPMLQQAYERHPDELVVLGVNAAEPEATVRKNIDELGITFNILLDPESQAVRDYHISGFPTTYLIDKEGMIKVEHIGQLSQAELDDYLNRVGLGS